MGNPSPRLSANFLSKLFFWWLKPLFYQGKARDLKSNDLHDALPADVSEQLGSRLEKYWKNEVENARQSDRKPKLVNAIRKAFGWSYFYYAGHMLVLNCLRVLQPFLMGLLIQYFELGSQMPKGHAYAYASGLTLLVLLHSLLKHHIDLGTLEVGMRLRIACSSLIYRKLVRLTSASASSSTAGQLINLLTNDVLRFDPLFVYLHYIWITPLQGALVAYLVWRNVGLASLAGVLIMALETIPVQIYIGKITSGLRGKIATKTDERVRLMGEIINGIHVIKMYTWEKPFESLVSLARRFEIDVITSMSYLRGVNISSIAFIDRTCLFFTLLIYVLTGNVITADKVFSMVQYFTILQNLLVYNYPRAIFHAAEARVSVKRIQKFLLLEEIKIKAPLLSTEENASISLKSVTASWSAHMIANTLHDITLYIAPKKLHAVVGPVGSGKSSLLQLILGELRPSSGEIKINGTYSYAGQRAWLFPGSIKDNVLFDQPYDEVRYRAVLRCCALERDLAMLPRGDRSQVGDRGTNLSGGQCARVNLARAVYRDADIYILDDPFAAVDPSVCKCLFNDCINGYLKDKTRIFVTHQVQCLKEADTIFFLDNGKLKAQGKFADLPKKELHFLNISEEEEDNSCREDTKESGVEVFKNEHNHVIKNDQNNILSKSAKADDNLETEQEETQELIAKGKMKSSIFIRYFTTGNTHFLLVVTVLFFLIAQTIRSGSDYWLAYWTQQEELRFNAEKNIVSNSTISTTEIFLPSTTENSLPNITLSTLLTSTKSVVPNNTTATLLPNSIETILSNTTQSFSSSTTQELLLSTTQSSVSSTTESLKLNTEHNSLSSTIESLLSETTQELLLNTTQSSVSSTTESLEHNSLSSTIENLLSETTENLISNTTESLLKDNLISTTIETLQTSNQSLLLNSTESSFPLAPENLILETTETALLNISKSLVTNLTTSSSNVTSNFTLNAEVTDYLSMDIALIAYTCILLACVFTAVTKCLLFYRACMNSSKTIHDEMFSCVLRAPMRFFDKQTSGHILNRFSKDTGAMDEVLPITMHESIEVLFIILGVIVQVLIINWWSIVPMIVAGFFYWKIRNFYLPTAYRIKRLEGAAKSPVLSHVTASLEGLATIRACRSRLTVCQRFDARQDAHTRAHFLNIAVASAFGLWLDLVSCLLVACVTFGFLFIDKSWVFAGGVGLAITQILMLCGMLQRGIRQTAESITQMTSVERILQFTELEQEQNQPGLTKPVSSWPSSGMIEFKEFCLRYNDDEEPILKNVNLIFEPGAKIGIVGRTGAGKSSLISALFRLARAEGQVLIDGVDTRSVGLAELRKRIAVIPQEPVLFSTSLRDNLDPFHEFEDKRLWAALEDVELHKAFVPLDHPIECGGRNLSAGQRQLLCLARAIVKNTRILVLDEATANVDPATDALIRRTIRSKFQDCTVLTVAHRLDSVMDSDRILVLEAGEIVEYDQPHLLLRKEDGHLEKMARQAGEPMLEHLKKVSKETYIRLNNEVSTTDVGDERTNANGVVKSNEHIEISTEKE